MEFRDLKKQYQVLKKDIDEVVMNIMAGAHYISGPEVKELESMLAEYVGVKHCITCANGTDALLLALRAWEIGPGDAVFVPDFTFFSTGEVVAQLGATPVFVDVKSDTFNIDSESLEKAVEKVLAEGKLKPKAVAPVDLFGQPADFIAVRKVAEKYSLKILEDGAQGFGGEINGKKACSFGDISTTSFFPAKPLGCYGDGGAVFTNDDEAAALIRSLCVHGKGSDKYNNIRIGYNSRLDTVQAGILKVKLKAFADYELKDINTVAARYTKALSDVVKTPLVKEGFLSSWAQYTLLLNTKEQREKLQAFLKEKGIPSMVYYPRPMHKQGAFEKLDCVKTEFPVTDSICDRVLSLPVHPYLTEEDQDTVIDAVKEFFKWI